MIPEKRVSIKKAIPFLLIGLLIFIGFLYLFVGIPATITVVQRINLFYYSLAIVLLFLNTLFYSLAWQYFLRPLSINASLKKTFLFVWIAYFIDLLIPAESISGDATKAYLMSKDTGENAGKVVASIVSHRILSWMIALSSLIIGSFSLLILKYELPIFILNLIILVAVCNIIGLVFLVLLCLREQLTQRIIDLLIRFLAFILRGRLQLASLRSKTRKALRAFHGSIEVLGRNRGSLVKPVVFSVVAWVLSLLLSFLVFISLGYMVPFGVVTIVYSITVAIQNIPIGVPGEVGLVEIVMTSLYIAFLGPGAAPLSAAATVLTRVITVGLRLFIGFIAVQWVGIKALMGSSR